ncbi:MAG: hypothetical protein ACTSWX_02110 [Promethearchaeota archaeon]
MGEIFEILDLINVIVPILLYMIIMIVFAIKTAKIELEKDCRKDFAWIVILFLGLIIISDFFFNIFTLFAEILPLLNKINNYQYDLSPFLIILSILYFISYPIYVLNLIFMLFSVDIKILNRKSKLSLETIAIILIFFSLLIYTFYSVIYLIDILSFTSQIHKWVTVVSYINKFVKYVSILIIGIKLVSRLLSSLKKKSISKKMGSLLVYGFVFLLIFFPILNLLYVFFDLLRFKGIIDIKYLEMSYYLFEGSKYVPSLFNLVGYLILSIGAYQSMKKPLISIIHLDEIKKKKNKVQQKNKN